MMQENDNETDVVENIGIECYRQNYDILIFNLRKL